MAELNWSDAQWQKVNDCVTDAFGKASVAGALLPCYGPLPASAENVREETLTVNDPTVTVTDDKTLKLFNLTMFVELSSEQVADESLSSALLAFRRAANTLALVEDDIVFNGYESERTRARDLLSSLPDLRNGEVVASAPDQLKGLVHADGTAEQIAAQITSSPRTKDPQERLQKVGQDLVTKVAEAIVLLEDASHPGPFACVLGHYLFIAVHTPTEGMVLPADRITAILGGPLLRSGRMGKNQGVVVSPAGGDIDIVVATPPKVQFLQVNTKAKSIFRVYEKFILRIKDATAARGIGG